MARRQPFGFGKEEPSNEGAEDFGRPNPVAAVQPEPELTWMGGPEDPAFNQRTSESPRERQSSQLRSPSGPSTLGAPGAGITSAPPMPKEPTPQAGAGMVPPVPSVTPFQPMPDAPGGLLGSSRKRGLYGSAGGLQGGGLGVPLDPTSNAQSEPISGLIEQLLKLRGR